MTVRQLSLVNCCCVSPESRCKSMFYSFDEYLMRIILRCSVEIFYSFVPRNVGCIKMEKSGMDFHCTFNWPRLNPDNFTIASTNIYLQLQPREKFDCAAIKNEVYIVSHAIVGINYENVEYVCVFNKKDSGRAQHLRYAAHEQMHTLSHRLWRWRNPSVRYHMTSICSR